MESIYRFDDISAVDEPLENDSHLPSANTYYATPSTSNRITVTKISSQIPALIHFDDDQSWYGSSYWQEMEREATENLAAGDYEEFECIDDFIASLLEN